MVAILMTLEGEYYVTFSHHGKDRFACRNPHDIGRRILRINSSPNSGSLKCRNPHDIGRRILLIPFT